MRFSIDIDNKKVAEQIERRIEEGIENAQDEIARGIKREAKDHIRRKQAIFRHELIEGFVDADLNFGGHYKISVRNVSDHAPAQEYGVSGVEEKRDTPLSFSTKMPPVTALIPWVRAHLTGTGFDPNWNPQDSAYSQNDGNGDNDGGGSGSSGGKSGGNDGNIANYDGYSASPLETEAGRTVFLGDRDEYAVIDSVTQGDDGVIDGAVVDYIESDSTEELPLSDFEVVPVDQEPIMVDSNKKYVPGINFRKYKLNRVIRTENTHPFQQVVVFDKDNKKYRRGEITSYPFSDGSAVEVQFHDDGGVNIIGLAGKDRMKIVGTRFWDSNTKSEKQDLLRRHFNENIIETSLNKTFSKPKEVTPDKYRLEWVRDNWIDNLWDNYADDYTIKEDIRSYQYQAEIDPSQAKNDYLAYISMKTSRENETSGGFLSKRELKNNFNPTEQEYIGTLRHETMHVFHGHRGYKRDWAGIPNKYKWRKTLKTADWQSDGSNANVLYENGDQVTAGNAISLMLRDDDGNDGVIGGIDWIEDAFDAANKSHSRGIINYNPNFNTNKANKTKRLMEAANRAFWLQNVRGNHKSKNYTNGISTREPFWVERPYSAKDAQETLATLQKVMTYDQYQDWDVEERIKHLHKYYPWLIEAWLGKFNPGADQKRYLDRLGYDV